MSSPSTGPSISPTQVISTTDTVDFVAVRDDLIAAGADATVRVEWQEGEWVAMDGSPSLVTFAGIVTTHSS